MFSINFNDESPLYIQIAKEIKSRIIDGRKNEREGSPFLRQVIKE